MILLWLTAGLLANGSGAEPPPESVVYAGNFWYKRRRTQEAEEDRREAEEERVRQQLRAEAERLAAEELEALELKARQEWLSSLDRLVLAYTLPEIPLLQTDVSAVAQSITDQWIQRQRRIQDEDDAIALILLLA